MGQYLMIPMRRWASQAKWFPYQRGERTAWKFQLDIGILDAGSSVTVDIQTSPTGFQQDWTTKVSFGSKSAIGTSILDASKVPTPDFTMNAWDRFMRIFISAITGSLGFMVTATSAFLDKTKTAEYNLLSQEFRKWQDGQDRVLIEAEADVVNSLLGDAETGELDIDLTSPAVHRLICLDVADQADHLMKRDILSRAADPSSQVTLRSMGRLFPNSGVRLRKYRSTGGYIWVGR